GEIGNARLLRFEPGGRDQHQPVDLVRIGRRIAGRHGPAHRRAGGAARLQPQRRKEHLVMGDIVRQPLEIGIAALAEIGMIRAIDAESVRQWPDPFEPVEGAAAVEIDQWLAGPDGIGHCLDPVDPVDDPLETVCAVSPVAHTGIGAPFISSASEEARTSRPPLPAWSYMLALSSARFAGSLSDSMRLK